MAKAAAKKTTTRKAPAKKAPAKKSSAATGKISQVIGAVVDVEFEGDCRPF